MTAYADLNRPVRQNQAIPVARDDSRLAQALPGEPRLPLAPLLAFVHLPGPIALARRYGVSPVTTRAWRDRGIPMGVAVDFAALTLGINPVFVWGDWYEQGLTDV